SAAAASAAVAIRPWRCGFGAAARPARLLHTDCGERDGDWRAHPGASRTAPSASDHDGVADGISGGGDARAQASGRSNGAEDARTHGPRARLRRLHVRLLRARRLGGGGPLAVGAAAAAAADVPRARRAGFPRGAARPALLARLAG